MHRPSTLKHSQQSFRGRFTVTEGALFGLGPGSSVHCPPQGLRAHAVGFRVRITAVVCASRRPLSALLMRDGGWLARGRRCTQGPCSRRRISPRACWSGRAALPSLPRTAASCLGGCVDGEGKNADEGCGLGFIWVGVVWFGVWIVSVTGHGVSLSPLLAHAVHESSSRCSLLLLLAALLSVRFRFSFRICVQVSASCPSNDCDYACFVSGIGGVLNPRPYTLSPYSGTVAAAPASFSSLAHSA
jgi:hypothetical protein